MSTREVLTAGRAPTVPTARPTVGGPWRQVPHLALVQALRVARHPATLLGLLWFVLGVGLTTDDDTTPYDRYTAATAVLVFLMGVPAYFAVNLVATSARRSGVDEWAGALPMPARHRTVALLLAAGIPGVIAGALSVGYLATAPGDTVLPVLWQHVASQAVALLGAGLLGVAVARLLPWPGVPMLVIVAVASANFWVAGHWPYLGAYVDFVEWSGTDQVPAREPGSASWHLVYLLALCALAAAGALLPDSRRRWVPFLAGAVAGSVVLVAGYQQLP